VATNRTRIGEKARRETELVFTSVYHHVTDVDNRRACYDALPGKRAVGIDGVTLLRHHGERGAMYPLRLLRDSYRIQMAPPQEPA
jgi:hypothetical protein